MADLACNISSGNICNVSGDIKSLRPPQIVLQDGSPLPQSITKGTSLVMKILNYNPSLKYIIKHSTGTTVPAAFATTEQSYICYGPTQSVGSDPTWYYWDKTMTYSNPDAKYMSLKLVKSGSCPASYKIYDENGNEIVNFTSSTAYGLSFGVRSGNYIKFVYSPSGDTNWKLCCTPDFIITWYNDMVVNETLTVNSDGTFTYNAPGGVCSPTLSVYFTNTILQSDTQTYTLNIT